jgi:formylglycine-generating enzyme required for sulfatase activity
MSVIDDERARAIAELEATLQLPLPDAAHQQLEATLRHLRREVSDPAPAPADSTASTTGTVGVSGTLRGAAVGVNQGTVQLFFGGAPDENTEPLLAPLLAWLEALARPDHSAAPAALHERTQALVQGIALPGAARPRDEVRLLLAQGLLQWVASSADLQQPASSLVRQSLGAAALMPLITLSPLPLPYLHALQQIASAALTQLVLNEGLGYLQRRRARNPAAAALTLTALTRALGETPYADGLAQLLADLSDPERGGPALAAAWHAQRVGGSRTAPTEAPDFLRLLAAGAIGGTIGAMFVAVAARQVAAQMSARPGRPEPPSLRHPTSPSAPPASLSVPVTNAEWRAALGRRNERFGEPAGYWCYVRPGTYRIGGWGQGERAADIRLAAFWIARASITVAQYTPFVAAGYHAAARRWWTPNGWQWKQERMRTKPWSWNAAPYDGPNQPVIGITWYEATAFCAWLTAQLADTLPAGYIVCLPTDAEWEAAAAYDEAMQRRPYPWGEDEPDAERAIYDASNLGRPAPIGCCPSGAAACGALDMVGNVWEMMANSYQGYPERSDEVIKDFTTDAGDVPWRGGGWAWDSTSVRCGARLRHGPVNVINLYGFRVVVAPRSH